jgi:hypothetical protein
MRCPKCNLEKSEIGFHKNKAQHNGRCTYCVVCSKAIYQHNKQQILAQHKTAYAAVEFRQHHMWFAAKQRALKNNLAFDIVPEDVIIPAICPILGIELRIGSGKFTGNSPTLDRIVPVLGYVRGNIRVISFRANLLKNNASAAELRLVANDAERLEASAR